MTEILCRWLNDELHLSTRISQASLAKEFASGYLIGEVLHKYQIQDDFDQFSQNKTSEAKLNNFTRLEPVFHLLGIPFDTTNARNIMTEKHGAATQLLYQLYIALNNKKKANLTGIAMETMRPEAPAKLNAMETLIYKEPRPDDERLKQATPRQTDLDLQALIARFQENQVKMEQTAFREKFEEVERLYQLRQKEREMLMNRNRNLHEKQSELVAKINAATVFIPKPPQRKLKALEARKELKKKREAEETIQSIHQFEEKMKMIPSYDSESPREEQIDVQYILNQENEEPDAVQFLKTSSNDEYIGKIRKRLQEDASAREEREKRRRKVLRDQLASHEEQEEARREKMMVNRLMRQSQQERRIAVQLLQARHEKEIIRQNRLFKEAQYQERRQKDFEEALDREAELAALHKLEYQEEIKAEQKLHNMIAAQRAEQRYKKHYEICENIVNSIVDIACKVSEYRELTNKRLPEKLMREWKLLFTSGQPLYEEEDRKSIELSPEQILEEERQKLLNEGDFMEYKTMTGEWQPPKDSDIKEPPQDNSVVGHIVHRLFNMVHPPSPPPVPPEFPPCPIRACVLGKVFSGKSSCLKRLAEEHRVKVLVVEELIQEAVEAFKNKEVETEEQATQTQVENEDVREELEINTVTESSPALNLDEKTLSKETVAASVIGSEDKQIVEEATVVSKSEDVQESIHSVKLDSVQKSSVEPEPTVRAKLGAKAFKSLRKGRPVEDQIVIDIIIEAIRKIPEGTGWILDGYPQNYAQAKLLEKGLSGCDRSIKDERSEQKLKSKSSLAPDPRPVPPPAEPPSGIDVVILFDLRDELCMKRAAGRSEQIQAGKVYHEEYNPPPDGSATGIGKVEKVTPVTDPGYDKEQIQTRITGFLDQWPKLEKWFKKYGTLQTVDASLEKEPLYLETEKMIEDILCKIQSKKEAHEEVTQQEQKMATETPAILEIPPVEEPQAPIDPPLLEVQAPRQSSGSGSRPEEQSITKSPEIEKSFSVKTQPINDNVKPVEKLVDVEFNVVLEVNLPNLFPARGSSAKKTQTPEPEVEVPSGPPPIKPSDPEWIFVDQNLDMELASVLSLHWEETEKAYINNCKTVFHATRSERENIFRYFYQIRKDFVQFLKRPDCKQEYVDQWQKAYNSIPDDMREDEETKAELHQQVDNLRERLWNICDERKEQAEKERDAIMHDGWLDDRLGLISNHYLTLMQAEVDRMQDTARLLKDYYKGMDGQVPDVLNPEYQRLPLLQLAIDSHSEHDLASQDNIVEEESKSIRSSSAHAKSPREGLKSPRSKSPRSPKGSRSSRGVSSKKNLAGKETPQQNKSPTISEGIGRKIIIPLIPRRPGTTEPEEIKLQAAISKSKQDKKSLKKSSDEAVSSELDIPIPEDPDEKLIHTSCSSAIQSITQMVISEVRAIEEEIEKEKELEREKEKEKNKPVKAGKKGNRSTSPKKSAKKEGDNAGTPLPADISLSEEEIQKKAIKNKAREEYIFALKEEENATKTRLNLIRHLACEILRDLKCKSDEIFKAMNDWIGSKFLKEMQSIDQLTEVMRNAIETKQKLKYELCISQEMFALDEDFKVLKTPTPEPPEPPVEQAMAEHFTVTQLNTLYDHLKTIAPTGFISNKAFAELFETQVMVAHGMACLPVAWMHLTSAQITELGNMLSLDTDYVDWHKLFVALCYPIPMPSQQQLLDCLENFKIMDQKSTGKITREQWHRMDLWFHQESTEDYNRMTQLHNLLFEVFADHSSSIPLVDYVNFLMYFSASLNYHEGFLHALSVVCGHHMPRLNQPELFPHTSSLERPHSVADSLHEDYKDEEKGQIEPPMSEEVISREANDALVSVEALFKVLHHGDNTKGDSHRFTSTVDPEDHTSLEKLTSVFQELHDDGELVPMKYKVLIEHPLIQDVVVACKRFKALDVKSIISGPPVELMEAVSQKTAE
uniref:Calponin-homology (CH) domain-containing protein n=1 Tax=Biomphalaria glabrata TaxID=6526 RepID=A0A2C9KBG9_BIOGL